MEKQIITDTIGWGFALWVIGYLLGILFFFALPSALIGWAILPVGVIVTLWVLLFRIREKNFRYYVLLAVTWTAIAVVCDYLFIVILLRPAGGYYAPDVFVYYLLMILLPLAIGGWKGRTGSRA